MVNVRKQPKTDAAIGIRRVLVAWFRFGGGPARSVRKDFTLCLPMRNGRIRGFLSGHPSLSPNGLPSQIPVPISVEPLPTSVPQS
jgi:hypothetical protein